MYTLCSTDATNRKIYIYLQEKQRKLVNSCPYFNQIKLNSHHYQSKCGVTDTSLDHAATVTPQELHELRDHSLKSHFDRNFSSLENSQAFAFELRSDLFALSLTAKAIGSNLASNTTVIQLQYGYIDPSEQIRPSLMQISSPSCVPTSQEKYGLKYRILYVSLSHLGLSLFVFTFEIQTWGLVIEITDFSKSFLPQVQKKTVAFLLVSKPE